MTNCIIDSSVIIGKDVIIEDNNVIKGTCVIGDGTHIKYGNYIENSHIGQNCVIEYSHIKDSKITNNCIIGPYSRIRPNSFIGENCKIGNFVEIKNSILRNNVKASHLSYIGDAEIGNNCNIGCGAIFVNYNGKEKNKTIVGDDCFIGSNVNVIAPVTIASGSYICAGTTLTMDTNVDDFVIGRAREVIKSGNARKYRKC